MNEVAGCGYPSEDLGNIPYRCLLGEFGAEIAAAVAYQHEKVLVEIGIS